ncbi:MAG: hypothetical protein DI563_02490 [Variovorax paradoxus]|uniref:Uncharacterized protein n=1 Tax=Variovorax paradoxus TaxID=34073 RepID=A0A2W5SSP9_VARPD|nr:MAG: hypothetical protein DI563_02490 [Variovorax paradoxus]
MNEAQDSVAVAAAIAVPEDRFKTAREAIFQIDAMVDMINRERQRQDDCFDIVLAACMPRLKQLVGVAMDVATDQHGTPIEELREVVYGS